ncbi:GNAT family N-acetyltransferase [Moraxella catarrhalis]|uniref:GNAT family N-acetyltransferase n=1 Tax=Moraxella catarrhalis TaxID=480 RepID=UPI00222885A5|nr:GNAT family N-acetyltransferase [Moraxella catarrhalis]
MPKMIASTNYVAVVGGELVAHLAVSTLPGLIEARACRLVVMPEWQGAGIGMRFLNAVCQKLSLFHILRCRRPPTCGTRGGGAYLYKKK